MFEFIAQAIGIVAMAFNIISFQMKTSKGAILCQLFGALLFAVNFFMLNAVVGGIMNTIALIRAVIYMQRDRFRASHVAWVYGFSVIYLLSYAATFTLLGMDFTVKNAVLEILPVVGMVASTVSFRMQSAKAIRAYGLISSPAWLIYNIANVALGAIICEVLSLGSILLGIWRYDLKKGDTVKER